MHAFIRRVWRSFVILAQRVCLWRLGVWTQRVIWLRRVLDGIGRE